MFTLWGKTFLDPSKGAFWRLILKNHQETPKNTKNHQKPPKNTGGCWFFSLFPPKGTVGRLDLLLLRLAADAQHLVEVLGVQGEGGRHVGLGVHGLRKQRKTPFWMIFFGVFPASVGLLIRFFLGFLWFFLRSYGLF